MVPINAPVIAPSGLKACEQFNRRAELSGSPNCAVKGFDAVSKNDRPLAITKSAKRKKPYPPASAAGQNKKAPAPKSTSPVTNPDLYPTRRIKSAAGIASRK